MVRCREMTPAQRAQEGKAHLISESQIIKKCCILPSFAIANGLWSCQAAGVCPARLKGNAQPAE